MIKISKSVSIVLEGVVDFIHKTAVRKQRELGANEMPQEIQSGWTGGSEAVRLSLSAILSNGKGPRDGMDYQLSRLNALRGMYEQFKVVKSSHDGTLWLRGTTKPIVMKSSSRGVFYPGRYNVYIPRSGFLSGTIGDMHLIPHIEPGRYGRTPHHTGHWDDLSDIAYATSSTCTGHGSSGFGLIFSRQLDEVDVAGFMRTVYFFISRYNPGSPLVTWSDRYDVSQAQKKELYGISN